MIRQGSKGPLEASSEAQCGGQDPGDQVGGLWGVLLLPREASTHAEVRHGWLHGAGDHPEPALRPEGRLLLHPFASYCALEFPLRPTSSPWAASCFSERVPALCARPARHWLLTGHAPKAKEDGSYVMSKIRLGFVSPEALSTHRGRDAPGAGPGRAAHAARAIGAALRRGGAAAADPPRLGGAAQAALRAHGRADVGPDATWISKTN